MRSRLLALATAVGAASLLLFGLLATVAFAQTGPGFNLGFAALAAQIPDIVGQPVEEEHYGPNGDSLQQTTTGLMAWRKADNWTAFTNGALTWVNGPEGLQERPNRERFNWERQARVESTQVEDFRPAGVRGEDQEGYCWVDSLASSQENAWRCMVGNRIYDPCFSTPDDQGSVICGASPTGEQYGFRLNLNRPLPARESTQQNTRPWTLELADGVTCGFLTGATRGYEGERINYGCTDGWYVLGEPTPGQVWTARQVLPSADRSTLAESVTVDIATVWR